MKKPKPAPGFNPVSEPVTIDDVRDALEGDYYALHYLKQIEALSPWHAVSELWPTREEAEAKAAALAEGRHACITIKPQHW